MNQPPNPSGFNPHHPQQPSPNPARPGIAPMPKMGHPPDELESIELADETPRLGPAPVSKIRAFNEPAHVKTRQWTRTPQSSGQGAIRVKSFHGKYSDQGLEYLDDAINDWIDHHPEVEVKFVTSTVGTFEGKIREPALVLNLWY